MNLKRRLEELEKRMTGGEIRLVMPSGATRTITAKRLVALVGEASRGHFDAEDMRAVFDSSGDNCQETGNGHLVQFIRVLAGARIEGQINSESEEETEQHAN